jgi:hypothetical protein
MSQGEASVLEGFANVHVASTLRARARRIVGVDENAGGAEYLRPALPLKLLERAPQCCERLDRERAVFF